MDEFPVVLNTTHKMNTIRPNNLSKITKETDFQYPNIFCPTTRKKIKKKRFFLNIFIKAHSSSCKCSIVGKQFVFTISLF
jgi:hypothetical protein